MLEKKPEITIALMVYFESKVHKNLHCTENCLDMQCRSVKTTINALQSTTL